MQCYPGQPQEGKGIPGKGTCTRPVVGGSTSLQEALQLQGLQEQRLQREMTKKGNRAFVCTKLDRTKLKKFFILGAGSLVHKKGGLRYKVESRTDCLVIRLLNDLFSTTLAY